HERTSTCRYRVAQDVAHQRAVGWIISREQSIAHASALERRLWKHSCATQRQHSIGKARRCGQRTQRRVVVDDIDAATEGPDDQIVLAPLNVDVAHGDWRKPGSEWLPPFATVERDECPVLGSSKQDVGIRVIFSERPDL